MTKGIFDIIIGSMVEEKIPDDAAEPSNENSGTHKADDSFVKKRLDHDGFFRSSFTDKKLVGSFAKEKQNRIRY